ncbi:hypothetical protein L2E82_02351 [Cichorium intybus]|uniref:Uncharacterized protein n=1 Tax=Cichorium intybus TaxID=13427 RepID=A0ACB9H3J4_CICIN|nr:hypothetical protein L1887_03889 [Cichorium endivia]KAI3789552.1 hypothetical protein L2E82_02351 [Cichorium intybus]
MASPTSRPLHPRILAIDLPSSFIILSNRKNYSVPWTSKQREDGRRSVNGCYTVGRRNRNPFRFFSHHWCFRFSVFMFESSSLFSSKPCFKLSGFHVLDHV